MNHNPDTYYQRSEVSNSDLTAIKNMLHPSLAHNSDNALMFGTLVDAIITEPQRVNYYTLTVDDVQYTDDDFRLAREMHKSLRMEARKDIFLARVLSEAETQVVMTRTRDFRYGNFSFELPTRCKWDWYFTKYGFGGDLKSTAAASQHEFENSIDFFDWDRSRAWYMDIAQSDRDFIYAISKKNCMVFKKIIQRDDETYIRGKEKYEELAFHYWCFNI